MDRTQFRNFCVGILLNFFFFWRNTVLQRPAENINSRRRGSHHYDVFISFRGSDVRKKFADHLRVALRREGVKVFADDSSDDMPRGENLNEAISQAIERSKVYFVVLSRNYASSEWCLDELVKIMQCCHEVDEGGRRKATPIFYHLSPDEVTGGGGSGWHKGIMERHKSQYTYKRVDGWLEALAWIADVSGWPVQSGQSEAQLVEKISRTIGRELREIPPVAAPGVMENENQMWFSPSTAAGGQSEYPNSPTWSSSNGSFIIFSLLLLLSVGYGLLVLYIYYYL